MPKHYFFILLFSLIYSVSSLGQDSLNANGKHYQFVPGTSDTVKSSGNTYIVKYVTEPDEADIMRSNGKIYVVVTVLATIFAGIFAYLVYLDRKISRLEKEKVS